MTERVYYGNGVFVSAVTRETVAAENATKRAYDEERDRVYKQWQFENRGWPRTQIQQEDRMTRFVEWRARQHKLRTKRRLEHIAVITAALMLGVPVVVTITSLLWKLAIWATL